MTLLDSMVYELFMCWGPLLHWEVHKPEGYMPRSLSFHVVFKYQEDCRRCIDGLNEIKFSIDGCGIVLEAMPTDLARHEAGLRSELPPPELYLEQWERDMFLDKLRSLNVDRSKIRDLLVFCVDRKIFAHALVGLICNEITADVGSAESFTSLESNHRLAVVYLLNDLFFNMPMSGMQDYGEAFVHLAHVFMCLRTIANKSAGRMSRSNFESAVHKLLDAWEKFRFVPPGSLYTLRCIFQGKEGGKEADVGGFHMAPSNTYGRF